MREAQRNVEVSEGIVLKLRIMHDTPKCTVRDRMENAVLMGGRENNVIQQFELNTRIFILIQ